MLKYQKSSIYIVNIYIVVVLFSQSVNLVISEEINEVCPYTRICNQITPSMLEVDNMIPCCIICECDEDCGRNFNCSFSFLDKYNYTQIRTTVCVDSRINKNSDKSKENMHKHLLSNRYQMVRTCDSAMMAKSFDKSHSSYHCRLTDKFGKPLLAPVSSLEDDSIYINQQCAACNNVNISLLKKWNYLFFPESKLMRISPSFDNDGHITNTFGTMIYVPPDDEDWSHKRCIDNFVEENSCYGETEWHRLCTRIYAPYESPSGYINKHVFCTLCNNKHMDYFQVTYTNDLKGPTIAMTALIVNTALIQESRIPESMQVYDANSSRVNCPTRFIEDPKGTCLMINCPEGMMVAHGGCSYFSLRWYISSFKIIVKLLPEGMKSLSLSELESLGYSERKNPLTWLNIPCGQIEFTNIKVLYSKLISEENTQIVNYTQDIITSLVVEMYKEIDIEYGIDPSEMIPLLHRCLQAKWKAKFTAKTYRFGVQFDKYFWYYRYGKMMISKWPKEKGVVQQDLERPEPYTLIAEGPRNIRFQAMKFHLELKKPFFCNQVHVSQSDVEVRVGEILIISKNITLGTNEYLVNEPVIAEDEEDNHLNMTTFSVCVDDYEQKFSNHGDKVICTPILFGIDIILQILFI